MLPVAYVVTVSLVNCICLHCMVIRDCFDYVIYSGDSDFGRIGAD